MVRQKFQSSLSPFAQPIRFSPGKQQTAYRVVSAIACCGCHGADEPEIEAGGFVILDGGGNASCPNSQLAGRFSVFGAEWRIRWPQRFGTNRAPLQTRRLFISGDTISGIREKASPGNHVFGGFSDASQCSWRGWGSQRRMGTRAGIQPLRILALYLCRKHNRAACPYATPSFRATAEMVSSGGRLFIRFRQ